MSYGLQIISYPGIMVIGQHFTVLVCVKSSHNNNNNILIGMLCYSLSREGLTESATSCQVCITQKALGSNSFSLFLAFACVCLFVSQLFTAFLPIPNSQAALHFLHCVLCPAIAIIPSLVDNIKTLINLRFLH